MKKIFLGLVFSLGLNSLSFANHYPPRPWFDVLNLRVGCGQTNTMLVPTPVLRPMAGNFLRISVPLACGPTQLFQIALFARSFNGGRVSIPAVFHHAENPIGYASYVYRINNGLPVVLSDVGVNFNTQAPNGCDLYIEQANF